MFRQNLDASIGTRFKILLDGLLDTRSRAEGGVRGARVRFCFDAQTTSAYGLRDSRVETDKGKKPGKGAESITKLDTPPKTRFRTARRRR
jgi:hypothetical protein